MKSNTRLGRALAFIAGAINAGGFMIVQQYTSHMTGIISLVADSIALNHWSLATTLLFYICCFIAGAATTAIMVVLARRHHIHSQFSLPILMEALLLIIFGVILYYRQETGNNIPFIIALLSYLMGLQNAVITKISGTSIRTTHITGMATDIGIEIGKILCASHRSNRRFINLNKEKLILHSSIVFMFLTGGISGAFAFRYAGFLSVIPLAFYLFLIAFFPVWTDVTVLRYLHQRKLRKTY